jgi:hypothetical protein
MLFFGLMKKEMNDPHKKQWNFLSVDDSKYA